LFSLLRVSMADVAQISFVDEWEDLLELPFLENSVVRDVVRLEKFL